MSAIGELLHGGPVDQTEVQRVRDVLLFEEPGLQQRLVRFWCLLILASAIATFGLIADSVATVIGAMIVAPLMLPIMGLAFGISIADRKAVTTSILVAIGGIVTAIGVGYVLSLAWPALRLEANSQIMARTSPRLVDLAAALATGLAGAFATGRKDVSDTLPGVAIAISLVPPLANVGILLAAGRHDLAAGSMLLFATNYLAIVLTGSFMFGIMGFPGAVLADRSPRARKAAILIVIVLALVVAVPLSAQSFKAWLVNEVENRASAATTAWLAGSDYRLVSAKTDGEMKIVIAGQGSLPDTAKLQQSLRGQLFEQPVTLEVLPEQQTRFSTK
jgi:uncharacterized hydrophobic protein (TIGR00271 family)